jgi:hypothetical protein
VKDTELVEISERRRDNNSDVKKKRFSKGNCDNRGLIIPKSKRGKTG